MTGAIEQARALPRARPDIFVAVAIAVQVSFAHRAELAIALEEEAADLACIGCGCTEERACPNGCSWASMDPPFCTSCAAADRLLEELMAGGSVHQVGTPPIPLDDFLLDLGADPRRTR